MICPACAARGVKSTISRRKTGQQVLDPATGQVVRVLLIACPACGPGKDVVTHSVQFYAENPAEGPYTDPSPLL